MKKKLFPLSGSDDQQLLKAYIYITNDNVELGTLYLEELYHHDTKWESLGEAIGWLKLGITEYAAERIAKILMDRIA